MTDMTQQIEQRMAPHEDGSRPTGASSARRRHAASFTDAVIAAYVHEISTRGGGARDEEAGRRG
jgi:hypothetical protein